MSKFKHYIKQRWFILGGSALLLVILLAAGVMLLMTREWQTQYSREIISTHTLDLLAEKIRITNLKVNAMDWSFYRGGITSVDDHILILKADYFYQLTTNPPKLEKLAISPPVNHRREHDDFYGNNKKFDNFLSYDQILALKTESTISLFLSYTHWNPKKKCFALRLARTQQPADTPLKQWHVTPNDWETIFESQPCITDKKRRNYPLNASGAALLKSNKPGHILLAVGTFNVHQNGKNINPLYEKSDYGKILEININNKTKRIISSGHRNPQGMAYDRKGQLWSVEHGPRGGDELNLIKPGRHYGWPYVSFGTEYDGNTFPNTNIAGRHEDKNGKTYEKPIMAFHLAPKRLILVENFAPEWDGDLLAITSYHGHLWRFHIVNNRVAMSEGIQLKPGLRAIYNMNSQNGQSKLILLSKGSSRRGKFQILILSPIKQKQTAALFTEKGELYQQAREVWAYCASCHTSQQQARGPDLKGVWNRKIGSTNWPDYSPALKRSNRRWNESLLNQYLTNPTALFPETSMPNPYINNPEIKQIIINHLKTLK